MNSTTFHLFVFSLIKTRISAVSYFIDLIICLLILVELSNLSFWHRWNAWIVVTHRFWIIHQAIIKRCDPSGFSQIDITVIAYILLGSKYVQGCLPILCYWSLFIWGSINVVMRFHLWNIFIKIINNNLYKLGLH